MSNNEGNDEYKYDYFSGEHGHGQGYYGGYDSRPSTPVPCVTGVCCESIDVQTPDQVGSVLFEPPLAPVKRRYSRALGDIEPILPPTELKRCHSRYPGEILTDEEEAFESASNAVRQSTTWSWSRVPMSEPMPPIPAPIKREEPMTIYDQSVETDIESDDITLPHASPTDLDGKKSSAPETQTAGEDCEGEDDMLPLVEYDEDRRVVKKKT